MGASSPLSTLLPAQEHLWSGLRIVLTLFIFFLKCFIPTSHIICSNTCFRFDSHSELSFFQMCSDLPPYSFSNILSQLHQYCSIRQYCSIAGSTTQNLCGTSENTSTGAGQSFELCSPISRFSLFPVLSEVSIRYHVNSFPQIVISLPFMHR